MTDFQKKIAEHISMAFKELFDHELPVEDIALQPTRKDLSGGRVNLWSVDVTGHNQRPQRRGHQRMRSRRPLHC